MFSEAQNCLEFGYSPIPLVPDGKKPLIPWKEFQNRRATPDELSEWFSSTRNNIGIVCGNISGGLFAKDFDERSKAEAHFKRFRKLTRTIVETRRGFHFYYRKPDARGTQGDKQDDRANGNYVVAPPSLVSTKKYRFVEGHGLVPPEELCELPEELVSKPMIRKTTGKISDARAYIRAIKSIQGERGSDACFRVACVLRDSGLSEAEALEEMIGWNVTNASPAWSLRELTHKVKSAFQKGARNVG